MAKVVPCSLSTNRKFAIKITVLSESKCANLTSTNKQLLKKETVGREDKSKGLLGSV